jgi:DUF1009 family protein
MKTSNSLDKLGIICGEGDAIHKIVEACKRQGREFFILAFEGHTDQQSVTSYPHAWVKLAHIGKALSVLRQQKVQELVFIGRFKRPAWSELRPDLVGAKWMARMVGKVFGDDSFLRAIIERLENEEGFKVISAEKVMGDEILVPLGVLGKQVPSKEALADVEHGIKVAQALGKADVGQSVIVQQGLVLGVEAIEGTDALIKRCGSLKREGFSGVLVKIVKPQQETRIDRPTVGPETIKNIYEAGFAGVAMEAGGVIMVQKERVLELADQWGLFLIGIKAHDA